MKKRIPRYFQWLDGEKTGQVETLNDITCFDGEYFYNFTSGESCNLRFISKMTSNPADLKGKFMVEVMNPSDLWRIDVISTKKEKVVDGDAGEILVDVPPLEDITGASGNGALLNLEKSKLGSKKYVAPKYRGEMRDLPSYDAYSNDYEDEPEEKPVVEPVQREEVQSVSKPTVKSIERNVKITSISESDPVRILAKTCKKHSTEVSLVLNIDLPSKAVYNIAKAEFEDGGKTFIDCIVEEIDVTDIVKSISNALYDSYESEVDE